MTVRNLPQRPWQYLEFWCAALLGLLAAGGWLLTGLAIDGTRRMTEHDYARWGEGSVVVTVIFGFGALFATAVSWWFYNRFCRQTMPQVPTTFGSFMLLLGALLFLMFLALLIQVLAAGFFGVMS